MNPEPQVNMRVLTKSRKRPKPGDIFVFQMPDGLFRYGRVIRTDAVIGGFPNCTLIYIYSATSATKLPVPKLTKEQLLVPPIGTNRQPWLRGYFETIECRPFDHDDVLKTHCFESPTFKKYFDDQGRTLDDRCEPCGTYALDSYRTIDDAVSRALGIALAPD